MPNDAQAARVDDRIRGPVAAPGVVLGGKYRLEEAIARGGMARVWRARHIDLNRPVAVKFVDGAGAGTSGIERFMVEAKVAASIRHKNVVDILDFGFVEQPDRDPEPYMVMELLEGETLGDRIERSPVSADDAVDITLQLLSGLDAVHRAGIIHRDLKPGNLFLTHDHDGTFARLLDFGISEGADQQMTGDAGQVVGTPEYMSPEQAFGAPIDLRADLYGVGIMLYEMLTGGRLPFEHDEAHRVLEMVVAGVHTPLVTLRPDQPELSAVIERALARNPEDRYASAREMRRAIIEASGISDNTTERMAAIRESGTRRRPGVSTAPELRAPSRPPGAPSVRPRDPRARDAGSLPAGSPLLVVPMPPSAPRRSIAPMAIGVVVALAAAVGAAWAMMPSTPSGPATVIVAPREAATVEAIAPDESAADEVDELAPGEVAPDEIAIDDAAVDETTVEETAADEAVDEAAIVDDPVPAAAIEEGDATAPRARRVRRTTSATEANDGESAPAAASTPADPPRAVVRDLDF